MTVKELLSRIDSREFEEWKIYYENNPFGEVREDIRAASICCTIANCFSKKKFKIDDFMLKFGKKRRGRKQTFEEQQTILQALDKVTEKKVKVTGTNKVNVNSLNTIS